MAMRTHDDQVRVHLLSMLEDAACYITSFVLVHMYFNRNSRRAQSCRNLFEIGLRFGSIRQVLLSMYGCWRMLLQDMQQCHLRVKTACNLFNYREH